MAASPRRPVRQLALARLLSNVGSSAAWIAVAYVLYDRTGSAYWLSAYFFLTFGINAAAAPIFGALADRVDRRVLMVCSDLLGALLFFVLVFAETPAELVLVTFLAALAVVPAGSASAAALPNLAAEEDLRWANSLVATTSWTGRLVGYGVGGVLLTVSSADTVFMLNGVSFVVSAALIWTIRSSFRQEDAERDERPRARDGFRFIFGDRILLSILIGWCLMFFAVNITTVANPPLAKEFGVGAVGYGALEAMYAGGAVIGAFGGRWLKRRLEVPALLFDCVAIAVASFLVVWTSTFWFVLFLVFSSAAFDSLASVAGYSLIQEKTADQNRGRVFGAMDSSFTIGNTVAFLAVAPLLAATGPRGVYAGGGAVAAVAFLVMVFRLRGFNPSPQSSGDVQDEVRLSQSDG